MVEAFESSQSHKVEFKKELYEVEIPLVQRKIEELRQQLKQEGFFDNPDTPLVDAVKRLHTIGDQVKRARERGQ